MTLTPISQRGLVVIILARSPWRIEMEYLDAELSAKALFEDAELAFPTGRPVGLGYIGLPYNTLPPLAAQRLAEEILDAAHDAAQDANDERWGLTQDITTVFLHSDETVIVAGNRLERITG
jgi:hypothetical protein